MTTPDANGWLPIESAPKDGTRVLLCCPRHWGANDVWGVIRVGKWQGVKWKLDMAGHYRLNCTHWQPLPHLPVQAILSHRARVS